MTGYPFDFQAGAEREEVVAVLRTAEDMRAYWANNPGVGYVIEGEEALAHKHRVVDFVLNNLDPHTQTMILKGLNHSPANKLAKAQSGAVGRAKRIEKSGGTMADTLLEMFKQSGMESRSEFIASLPKKFVNKDTKVMIGNRTSTIASAKKMLNNAVRESEQASTEAKELFEACFGIIE